MSMARTSSFEQVRICPFRWFQKYSSYTRVLHALLRTRTMNGAQNRADLLPQRLNESLIESCIRSLPCEGSGVGPI